MITEETEEFDFDSLIQLTQVSAKELRLTLHLAQNEICPLLGIWIPPEDTALDHKHKRKSDPCGPNGDGLVRGVISFRANALEGKITNAWKRQFGFDETKHPISLPNFLRNLADYLENPPVEQIYIHPTEKLKRPKVNKNQFNLVKRYWKEMYPKRKYPTFPKSGKLTEELKGYIDEAQQFDQSVKSGKIKKLGVRDKKRIENYCLEKPKIKPPYLGKFITVPIQNLLDKINQMEQ